MPDLSPTVLAIVSAILGGGGLKFIDFWLGRAKVKDDSAANFRQELRDEVKNLRDQVHASEVKAEAAETKEAEWREKYFALIEENAQLKAEAALRPKTRAKRPV